ncbi:MAG TPA: hypothetical protein VK447_03725 [Myxococcaceae bacterium]|nr:hypothetical protein [Myxococcaceae bacterium]
MAEALRPACTIDEALAELSRPRPVLALMQNQWFRNPERVRDLMEGPHRRAYIHIYLFAGCLTGRRIEAAFGDLCDRRGGDGGLITFEEASPQIGGHASSRFPADMAHLRRVVADVRPKLVLAFGRIAGDALPLVWTGPSIIGPHPAARGGDVVPRLRAMAHKTRAFLAEVDHG